MFTEYKALETTRITPKSIDYYHPDTLEVITLETPALDVLADFYTKRPRVIHKSALASEAIEEMQKEKIKALLVIDDEDHVIGLLNAARVHGNYNTQIAQQHGITTKEVTSAMLMAPINTLPLLEYHRVKDAQVGHIARLLHESNLDHILVIECDAKRNPIIRGIFSASFIGRHLGKNIGVDLGLNTLAEINKII